MKKNIVSVILISGLVINFAKANETNSFSHGKWSAGLGISTLGIGVNVGYKFNESFKVRGLVNYFQINKKINGEEFNTDAKLRLFTAGILADWHVTQNSLRLTAGLAYNGNRLNIKATAPSNVTINGRVYTPRDLGEVNGHVDFRKIAPYIGIGYDSSHESKTGFSFTADAGVLFQGKAHGKITSITGLAVNVAQAIDDAKSEIVSEINKKRWIKTYPVIAVGLSYKF